MVYRTYNRKIIEKKNTKNFLELSKEKLDFKEFFKTNQIFDIRWSNEHF